MAASPATMKRYVLDGEITFWAGDLERPVRRAVAGTFVSIPRGAPHSFRIETETARFVTLHTRPDTVPGVDTAPLPLTEGHPRQSSKVESTGVRSQCTDAWRRRCWYPCIRAAPADQARRRPGALRWSGAPAEATAMAKPFASADSRFCTPRGAPCIRRQASPRSGRLGRSHSPPAGARVDESYADESARSVSRPRAIALPPPCERRRDPLVARLQR